MTHDKCRCHLIGRSVGIAALVGVNAFWVSSRSRPAWLLVRKSLSRSRHVPARAAGLKLPASLPQQLRRANLFSNLMRLANHRYRSVLCNNVLRHCSNRLASPFGHFLL
jgi:hypothetical protein